MSGTSLDGLDLAAVRFWQLSGKWEWQLEACEHIPYPEQWYARLVHLPQQNGEIFWNTHIHLGHFLGEQAAIFIKKNNLDPDFVASHGQTIFHNPNKGYTAQIGDGETMATYLPCLSVTNFRARDVALGGQGAPLVPVCEPLLFPDIPLFLNLGGIANISIHHLSGQTTGWDIVPCNLITNYLYQLITKKNGFDSHGLLAQEGKFNQNLYETLNQWSYLKCAPPKSTGREAVENEVIPLLFTQDIPLTDILNTYHHWFTDIITETVVQQGYSEVPILITGGGFHNDFSKFLLTSKFSNHRITVLPVTPEIIDYKEALIFAFMGLLTLLGETNTNPNVTRALRSAVSGCVHQPGKAKNSVCILK